MFSVLTVFLLHVIDILIIIQPQQIEKKLQYRITVCFKKTTIRDFGPALPYPPIFEPTQIMKNFLLTKGKVTFFDQTSNI